MRRTLPLLLALTALPACDDGESSPQSIDPVDLGADLAVSADGGAPDAAPDAAFADAGADSAPLLPDAAVPEPTGDFCQPCGLFGCNEGLDCVFDPDEVAYCTMACEADADCPTGARCANRGGERRCVPPGERCGGWLGRDCEDDDGCHGEASVCVDHGYCAVGCDEHSDCPVGHARCVDGLCRADTELTPAGCGRGMRSCDTGCEGEVCVSDLLDALPDDVEPFCTAPCEVDDDCPDGARCRAVGETRLCLERACACVARPAEAALLDDALALAGVDRCTAGFDPAALARFPVELYRDPFRLSFFNAAHLNAVGGYEWARAALDRLDSLQPSELMGPARALADLPGPPAEPVEPSTLVEALEAAQLGRAGFDAAATERALEGVPPALQAIAGRLVRHAVAIVAARRVDLAIAEVSPDIAQALFELGPTTMVTHPEFTGLSMVHPEIRRLLSGDLRLQRMSAAAHRLTMDLDAQDWSEVTGAMGFEVEIDTPLGRVILNDAGSQTVGGDEQVLLLIDTGGDDRYEAPIAANQQFQRPASIAIDLAGNDRYGYPGDDAEPALPGGIPPADAAGRYDGSHPQVGDAFGPISRSMVPRQGAGIFGVGVLYDRAGDDEYRSLRLSQGAAVLGVGVLFDRAGRDVYLCEQGCQGAATYGIALQVDAGTDDDRYVGVQSVQGFAYVRAVGYLVDGGGDDEYLAVTGDADRGGVHLYPNAQNPDRSNTSLAQGAGFGRRADFSDGVFASGGLGIFRDLGDGADRYTVDIFGQGTGFWFGTGVFQDGGGDDVYSGRWYNQGSGAHYAMAFFFEEGGDDVYNPNGEILATAVGQGHDFTLGWLVDYGGNDTYTAPGLGVGAGNENGIGVFLDLEGDDTYDAPDGRTFGACATAREAPLDAAMCLGIFVDAQGDDTYSRFEDDALIGNDRRWSLPERREARKPGERGAGIDVDDGALSLP